MPRLPCISWTPICLPLYIRSKSLPIASFHLTHTDWWFIVASVKPLIHTAKPTIRERWCNQTSSLLCSASPMCFLSHVNLIKLWNESALQIKITLGVGHGHRIFMWGGLWTDAMIISSNLLETLFSVITRYVHTIFHCTYAGAHRNELYPFSALCGAVRRRRVHAY